jgi:protocatechuate 3,4-dioxygenase beta subunit
VVFGRVTDPTGAPVADRELAVAFRDAAEDRILAGVGDDGSFAATGLQPGTWLVACSARGFLTQEHELQISAADRVVRRDLVIEPAVVLRIRVTAPDGRPFHDALRELGEWTIVGSRLVPVATVAHPGATFDGVRGSLNNPFGVGSYWQNGYRFERLPAEYLGVLVLREDPPVHVSLVLQSAVLATQRVEPGAEEVRFTLDPRDLVRARAGLVCRAVSAATGEPIEGVDVTLSGTSYFVPATPTDGSGVVRFEGREPGRYELVLRANGLGTHRRDVELEPGAVLDAGTIELAPETWIAGRVVDASGEPAPAILELGRVGPDGSLAMIRSQMWSSDERGSFRIGALEPGDYVVRTQAREGRPGYPGPTAASENRCVSTRGGPVEELLLMEVPLGRIVLLHEREDFRDLRIELVDPAGIPRVVARIWQEHRCAFDAPRGAYRLRVLDASGVPLLERDLELGPDPVEVTIPAK